MRCVLCVRQKGARNVLAVSYLHLRAASDCAAISRRFQDDDLRCLAGGGSGCALASRWKYAHASCGRLKILVLTAPPATSYESMPPTPSTVCAAAPDDRSVSHGDQAGRRHCFSSELVSSPFKGNIGCDPRFRGSQNHIVARLERWPARGIGWMRRPHKGLPRAWTSRRPRPSSQGGAGPISSGDGSCRSETGQG